MDCRDGIVYFSASAGGDAGGLCQRKNKGITGQAANHLVNEGMKSAFPEIIFRGGVNLEDGAKYRSSEFDMFIPVQKQHRLYSLASLAFATTTAAVSMAAPMLTLVWVIAEVNGWLLGVNTFLDADIRYSHLRGGIGGEVYKDSLAFSGNYYFLSPAGKRQ